MIDESYDKIYDFYLKNLEKIELKDWEQHFKKAKEPIMWLSNFHEIKTNKSDFTNYIIYFDATCSGSQIISLFVNDDTYLKYLNMQDEDKVYDYYTYIYNQYGGFKDIQVEHARKIVKKAIMTINYGLTRIGCHRYIFKYLKEFNYLVLKKEYNDKWKLEVDHFYDFIENIPLVQKLNSLQDIWKQYCKKNIIYDEFIIGEMGFITSTNVDLDLYRPIFCMKTFSYKKYYKNLSLYNKTRKMKEKGFKYLWHHKKLNQREQVRKIKANIIHMMDATWNMFLCEKYMYDIAPIHDCHGIHSYNIDEYIKEVRQVLVNLFTFSNQYYNLLKHMLDVYLQKTKDVDFYNNNVELIKGHYNNVIKTFLLRRIKASKYLFIPK